MSLVAWVTVIIALLIVFLLRSAYSGSLFICEQSTKRSNR
jgi:hypothetical protein